MIGAKEILRELDRRKVERKEIAELLDIPAGQVTRMFYVLEDEPKEKPRRLQHDEAVKLVERYGLEPAPQVKALPPAVWRFVSRHVAARLGLSLEEGDPLLKAVAADLAGLSRFFRNPQVEATVEAAHDYFQAVASYQEVETEDLPESNPQPAR